MDLNKGKIYYEKEKEYEKEFEYDKEYMAAPFYSIDSEKIRRRRVALHFIFKISQSEDYDAMVPYLAMSYFDRFLSRHHEPTIFQNWNKDVKIVALACLNIACTTRKTSFDLTKFVEGKNSCFKTKHVTKATHTVLVMLKWKIHYYSPLCCIGYFIKLCRLHHSLSYETVVQIVLETTDDIRFTAYRPHIIIASALLAAYSCLCSLESDEFDEIRTRFKSHPHIINPEEFMTCTTLMIKMCDTKNIKVNTETAEIKQDEEIIPQRKGKEHVIVDAEGVEMLSTMQRLMGQSGAFGETSKSKVESLDEIDFDTLKEFDYEDKAVKIKLMWITEDRACDALHGFFGCVRVHGDCLTPRLPDFISWACGLISIGLGCPKCGLTSTVLACCPK